MNTKKYYLVIFGIFLFITLFSFKASYFTLLLKNGEYIFNLINKENTVDEYIPSDLVELSSLGAPGKEIREIVRGPLKNMLKDSTEASLSIKVLSAYRSHEKQNRLFSWYKKRFRDVERFSAEAGHSEHQLGTTIDFGVGNPAIDFKEAFANTPEGKWLHGNAWRYGFMMSYPEGYEEVTGYIYEPWHYRYIGREAAREARQLGLTLQEYLIQKPQYYDIEP